MIEYCSFRPVERKGSLVGFTSFKYDGKLVFNELPVHRRLKAINRPAFRVLYPEGKTKGQSSFNPINKELQEEIDLEVSGYILANYPHLKEYSL